GDGRGRPDVLRQAREVPDLLPGPARDADRRLRPRDRRSRARDGTVPDRARLGRAGVARRRRPADARRLRARRWRGRLPLAELLERHAPADWREQFRVDELLDAIIDGEPIQMFVMSADIRSSTLLMKEAVRFERFASIMDKFVSAVRRGIGRSGGWFDKFTGDGFLAYWIVQSGSDDEYHEHFVQAAGNITYTARTLVDLFQR